LIKALAGFSRRVTAGGEFHPALRIDKVTISTAATFYQSFYFLTQGEGRHAETIRQENKPSLSFLIFTYE